MLSDLIGDNLLAISLNIIMYACDVDSVAILFARCGSDN